MSDLERLARLLTGYEVRVHFAPPPGNPTARGFVRRAPTGFEVYIAPGLPAREAFRAYCHEVGHILADGPAFAVAPLPSGHGDAPTRPNPSLEARAEAVAAALMRLVPPWATTVEDMARAVLDKLTKRQCR
ncbi:MAG: hypothetical protein Kow00123_12060 [Anaerolineales bacterium]